MYPKVIDKTFMLEQVCPKCLVAPTFTSHFIRIKIQPFADNGDPALTKKIHGLGTSLEKWQKSTVEESRIKESPQRTIDNRYAGNIKHPLDLLTGEEAGLKDSNDNIHVTWLKYHLPNALVAGETRLTLSFSLDCHRDTSSAASDGGFPADFEVP
ncbi:hypothetical protein TRIP_C20334 [Candidatus Zixiibacteriota bacterium]|nr:hypothetical protein TRIP_C20334 [candidate division Zixibacteria bacterium]